MRFIASLWLSALALQAPFATAKLQVVCSDKTLYDKIEAAVLEAIKLANFAYGKLESQPYDEWMAAALTPLFETSDATPLMHIYDLIRSIPQAPEEYTVYCSEDVLSWNAEAGEWMDDSFTYPYTGIDESQMQGPVSIGIGTAPELDSTAPPGQKFGVSWTIVGNAVDVNGDFADCTFQRHIYINPNTFDIEGVDQRSYVDIIANGFLPGFDNIDSIDPPSRLVLHELAHAVGGQTSTGVPFVTDGADGERFYLYDGVVKANKARNEDGGVPTYRIAESVAYGAKIMALSSVQGKAVWWSTGRIYLDTFMARLAA